MPLMEGQVADNSNSLFIELENLLLWRNWQKSAIIFMGILLVLVDIVFHSVISVVSMTCITMLLISIGYRCYDHLMQSWNKTESMEHPYRCFLEMDFSISREKAMYVVCLIVDNLNILLLKCRSLFFVENIWDSCKLLLALCGINLLGDCFNGITLVVLAYILIFTLPKLYEWNKVIVDTHLEKFLQMQSNDSHLKEENLAQEAVIEPTTEQNLYKVCDNMELFELLVEEHGDGCCCRDCQDIESIPIEAH
ncbi:reticulon-3 [Drosophila tropicalis]|uniref:reticulon-3 n=1 Tax=Drosophila tropicalis TaxID=46794 RepID=UPI0035ABA74A